MEPVIFHGITALITLPVGGLGSLGLLTPRVQGAKSLLTLGTATPVGVQTVSTGSKLLDALGLRSFYVPSVEIELAAGLAGPTLTNVLAHEAFHAWLYIRYPTLAVSSGRLPFIGSHLLYAEEIAAYSIGAYKAGQYGRILLSPLNAVGSLRTAEQVTTVIATGAFGAGGTIYVIVD